MGSFGRVLAIAILISAVTFWGLTFLHDGFDELREAQSMRGLLSILMFIITCVSGIFVVRQRDIIHYLKIFWTLSVIQSFVRSPVFNRVKYPFLLIMALRDLWSVANALLDFLDSGALHQCGNTHIIVFWVKLFFAVATLLLLIALLVASSACGVIQWLIISICSGLPIMMIMEFVFPEFQGLVIAVYLVLGVVLLFSRQQTYGVWILLGCTSALCMQLKFIDIFGWIWLTTLIAFGILPTSVHILPAYFLECITALAWVLNELRVQPFLFGAINCIQAKSYS